MGGFFVHTVAHSNKIEPAPPDGPRSKGIPVTITCAGNRLGRTWSANTEALRRRGPVVRTAKQREGSVNVDRVPRREPAGVTRMRSSVGAGRPSGI